MSKNIGFVSTRFAGQDGVSLESAKWAEVLWEDRHVSFGTADKAIEIQISALLYPRHILVFRKINGSMSEFGEQLNVIVLLLKESDL